MSKFFFFRSKQNWGNQAFYPKHDPDDSIEDILCSFISQFYENKTIPRLILTNCEVKDKKLIEKTFSEKDKKDKNEYPPLEQKGTPGSMNRLFNDFFRKFAGVILGVFLTIWG